MKENGGTRGSGLAISSGIGSSSRNMVLPSCRVTFASAQSASPQSLVSGVRGLSPAAFFGFSTLGSFDTSIVNSVAPARSTLIGSPGAPLAELHRLRPEDLLAARFHNEGQFRPERAAGIVAHIATAKRRRPR